MPMASIGGVSPLLEVPPPRTSDFVAERWRQIRIGVLPVVDLRGDVALQGRPHGVESGQTELVVDSPHLTHRVLLQLLERQLVEPAVRNEGSLLEERLVHG